MATTIRTREPRELLALLPYQLGFHPNESAVLVSLRGSRSLVGLTVRADLADLADEAHGVLLARTLVGHLVSDGARRAVVVVYTAADLQGRARCEGSVGAGVGRLLRAVERELGPAECWVVGPRGYYALGCADEACCPRGGRPLADLQATQVGAQMVLEGVQVAASREELGAVPPADAAARKSARRARARWAARGAQAGPGAEAHRWRREGLRLWQDAFTAQVAAEAGAAWTGDGAVGAAPRSFGPRRVDLAPSLTGRLLAALDDVLVRDAVLVTFVEGNDRLAERVLAGERGVDVGVALGPILDPCRGRRPDARRARAARAVLEHLLAHVPRDGHPAVSTLLAVLAWWEGDGARAGVCVDRALATDPDYRLAVLVDQALRAGMPPGWVRAAG